MESVVLDGDRQLAYVRFGDTQGPVVLLLHGMGDEHEEMLPLGKALQEQFDVVIPDLPGHGASYRDPQRCSINGSADDVASLCDLLSIPRCHVVGHSRGGHVAMALSARHQRLVSRSVILDTGIARPQKTLDELTRFYDSITLENYETRLRDVLTPMLFKPGDSEQLVASTFRHMRDVGPAVFCAMGYDLVAFDNDDAIRRTVAPTLLIIADSPFNTVEQLREVVPEWTVADFTHLSHHRLVESEEVFRAIEQFLT